MGKNPMQFQPGNPGGPGRPKGSKNKLSEDFLSELHSVFQKSGRQALETMCADSPAEFIRVCANLIPKEFLLEIAQEEPVHWVINASPQLTNEEWCEKHGTGHHKDKVEVAALIE